MAGKNYLREYSKTLVQAGFEIVPLLPNEKLSILTGWNTPAKITKRDVDSWIARGFLGIGIRNEWSPVVDLDIGDADIARQMLEFCNELVGPSIIRVGQAPRMSLLFRTEVPFRKGYSSKYVDDNGVTSQIEILGKGQQSAMLGVHPKTNEPFYYITPDGEVIDYDDPLRENGHILDASLKGLTPITHEQTIEIIKHFDSLIPPWWDVVTKGKDASVMETIDPTDDSFMLTSTPPLNVSDMKIVQAMESIPNDPPLFYDDWLDIGMAVWHQFGGGELGLNLWLKWSEASPTFDEKYSRERWKSFAPAPGVKPKTFATVLMKAKEAGGGKLAPHNEEIRALFPKLHAAPMGREVIDEDVELVEDIAPGDDLLDEYHDRYIYCEFNSEVFDTRKEIVVAMMPYSRFALAQANRRMDVPAPTQKEPDKTKSASVAPIWLASAHRKTVYDGGYFPGQKMIYKEHNVAYINQFHFPPFNTKFVKEKKDAEKT